MYNNIYYDRASHTIFLNDDEKGLTKFPYQPYCYKKTDNETDLKTIYGVPVQKTFYAKELYESDLRPEFRVLRDRYLDSDEPGKNVVEWMDIETDSVDGFPNIDTANKTIITITSCINNIYTVFFLELIRNREIDYKRDDVNIRVFRDETEMLKEYIRYVHEAGVTITLAWNGDEFDFWYIYNRLQRLKIGADSWSPSRLAEKNVDYGYVKVCGINLIDYMKVYKNPVFRNKLPSYSLDAVGLHELGIGKVSHKGLDTLYTDDVNLWIKYAVRDVEIMVGIEEKKEILGSLIMTCHKAHIPYEWFHNSSSVAEGSVLTFFKRKGLVSINNENRDKISEFKVHEYKPGEPELQCKITIPKYVPEYGTLQLMNPNGLSAKKDKSGDKYLIEYNAIKKNCFVLEESLTYNIKENTIVKMNISGAFVLNPVPGLYK